MSTGSATCPLTDAIMTRLSVIKGELVSPQVVRRTVSPEAASPSALTPTMLWALSKHDLSPYPEIRDAVAAYKTDDDEKWEKYVSLPGDVVDHGLAELAAVDADADTDGTSDEPVVNKKKSGAQQRKRKFVKANEAVATYKGFFAEEPARNSLALLKHQRTRESKAAAKRDKHIS